MTRTDPAPRGLAELQTAARQQGRRLLFLAVALVVGALVLPTVLLLAQPVSMAQALGRTTRVEAVVQSVVLSTDQPRRNRQHERAWTMTVRYFDQGVTRLGAGDKRARTEPFAVGDRVSVATAPGRFEVSFRSDRDARLLLIFLVLVPIGLLGGAALCWSSRRRWVRLPGAVVRSRAHRVRVAEPPTPHRPNRQAPVNRYLIDYRPVDPTAGGGQFAVVARNGLVIPDEGEELDIWSSRRYRRSPFAVQRVSGGQWWVGDGPDPVPSTLRSYL